MRFWSRRALGEQGNLWPHRESTQTSLPLLTRIGTKTLLATINTLRSRGELSGTDSSIVKKHACWVCFHAHSQFENRSSREACPGCLSCVALPDGITLVLTLHLSPAILRETSRETSY